ncbi:RNA polymerase Rpb1, domain 1 [Ancylostoma duodenale]|uniref:DNA-directed RNA polymerase subunit n=1 Tax=Ancylostoma duodenale TaxID=51022 RepID=A0A0C2G279_9BILA|nr:RNA polymerase Rpb1, domain 1 [Ancylostoma duodenale]
MGKEQFRDFDLTRKVAGIKFMAGDSDFMRQTAHVKILTSRLYENVPGKFIPAQCGPLDLRLSCSGLLLGDEQRAYFLRQISNPNLEYIKRKAIHECIVASCKKTNPCSRCGKRNGMVKKASGSVMKIVYSHAITEESSLEYTTATTANSDLSTALSRAKFTLLNPLRVQKLFSNISEEDIAIVMARSGEIKHPSDLLLTRIPVPPPGTTEDDITMKLSEIILINEVLRKHKVDGAPVKTVTEAWDHLQIQVALYFNSELSGLPMELQPKKPMRAFTQRLKGKQGRFRGNLSGKRVDFSARTVISPDPNLRIDEIPIHIALTLTFPEVVNCYNIDRMRRLILNGCDSHPGANYVIDRVTGVKRLLK